MVNDLQENEDIGPSSNIPSTSSPSIRSKINLDDLHSEPADRPPITSGREVFVSEGFCNWSKPGALKEHVGEVNSAHNNSVQKCDNILNQKDPMRRMSLSIVMEKRLQIGIALLGSVCSSRFLLENSLLFRGHNESEDSFSKGIFLEILKLVCENNPDIAKRLCEEFKDDVFGLLADESSDVYQKEQMTIVLRYVDKHGVVKESLIVVAHINNTSSAKHKEAIVFLLSNYQLSIDQVRGQGYDGASNMRGKFNGLKASIFRNNPSAHYIHCFAHQLHLGLTNSLSKHLQKKSQDLLEASKLISGTNRALNYLRQTGFDKMLVKVTSFCEKTKIRMLDIEESYGKQGNRKYVITNRPHFDVEVFNTVLDMQIQEHGNRCKEIQIS
ncbi:uncharacterized protein LOC143598446 [Bidens hawaiensis]|uniref:uncharacterized protein LOC143598446 n=1 Tax=Bidens hawaiensis TaxID=980011 RepID=UPI00404A2E2B